jgi:hypothetical protein
MGNWLTSLFVLKFGTVSVLIIWIIFAKETMGPSLTSAAADSSQKFTPKIIQNLRKLIKILVVERFI